MKRKATITTTALLLCAMVGTAALAKNKIHTLTFEQDTTVNGTVIKKGAYQASFNEQTSELAILHGHHVLVTTGAREVALNKKAPETSFELKESDSGPVLTKVTFGGDRYSLMIGDSGGAEGQ